MFNLYHSNFNENRYNNIIFFIKSLLKSYISDVIMSLAKRYLSNDLHVVKFLWKCSEDPKMPDEELQELVDLYDDDFSSMDSLRFEKQQWFARCDAIERQSFVNFLRWLMKQEPALGWLEGLYGRVKLASNTSGISLKFPI